MIIGRQKGPVSGRIRWRFSNQKGELFLCPPIIIFGQQALGWKVYSWPEDNIEQEFALRGDAEHFIEVLLGEPIPAGYEQKEYERQR